MEYDIQIENCCYICSKRSFNNDGFCCGLTQYIVDIADCCDDFLIDEDAKKELITNIRNQEIDDRVWDNLSEADKYVVKHSLLGKIKYIKTMADEEKKADS